MNHVPTERAVGVVEMILSVKFIEAPPAELVLTVFTLHVLATTGVDDNDFTLGASFSTSDLIHVNKSLVFIYVRQPVS